MTDDDKIVLEKLISYSGPKEIFMKTLTTGYTPA